MPAYEIINGIEQSADTAIVNCVYEPKPDITAYELALLMPFLIDQAFLRRKLNEAGWLDLGTANRHLRRVPID